MAIDELDSQLIDLLMQDANVNSNTLGKQLSVHSSTVRRRVKRLLKDRIINIVASPNLSKIGLPVTAFISFEVVHDKTKSVLAELCKCSRVAWVGTTSGRFNVRTVWWVSSTEELNRIIDKEIGRIDGILRIETSICLQVAKHAPNNFSQISI